MTDPEPEIRNHLIAIENGTYRRQGNALLEAISWHVNLGEHWALIGENGSGKTTLMKMIAGWIFPSSGQVKVMGRRFGKSDLTELRSQVGWVSSVVADEMPSRLSARNVVLSGCLGTIGVFEEISPEMEETADFFLDMLRITDVADRAFGILSQGERMRTLIARALAARPILLILDEPCAGLDPVARTRFLEILDTLLEHPDAPPVLLVTHHVEEIVDGISHVIGLREGVVVASGTKDEVLNSATISRIFNADIDLIEEENYRTIRVNL